MGLEVLTMIPKGRTASLGTRIRQARRAAGLTQAGLAVRVGVSTTTLHKIEVGRIPDPRVSTVVKIADVLQVRLDALVGGTNNHA